MLGHQGFALGLRVFRYQHVGISNAESSRWGCYPLAVQWNIGFILSFNENVSLFNFYMYLAFDKSE